MNIDHSREVQLLERLPFGICITDEELTILFWNHNLQEITNLPATEVVGRCLTDRFPHLLEKRYLVRLRQVLGGGPPAIFSPQLHPHFFPAPLGNQELRRLLTIAAAIPDQGGRSHLLLTVSDVTQPMQQLQEIATLRETALREIEERKKTESQLRESRQRFLDMTFISADWIWETDRFFRFIYTSGRIKPILGYEPEELLHKNLLDLLVPEVKASHNLLLQEIFSAGRAISELECRVFTRDGRTVDLLISGIPLYDNEGGFSGYRGVAKDITDRRRLEEELLRARTLDSIGLLAGGLAHEFNNQLTAILGGLSLARLQPEGGEALRQALERAERAALRARDMLSSFITFSQGGKPVRRRLEIAPLLREVAAETLAAGAVWVEFLLPPQPPLVEVDELQFRQAVQHIVQNAVEAMERGGRLEIGVSGGETAGGAAAAEPVQITFRDQGHGIAPEHLPHIFDPYFTTREDHRGLGLAVAYSVIKNHNGRIAVESKPGSGTTVRVSLPAATSAPAASPTPLPTSGQGKILLMDDEETIRHLVTDILTQRGYTVQCAEDGQEALAMYRREMEATGVPFAAVIMDLTIPGKMGGKECIRKLLEYDPRAKVLVSSGYSSDPIMANYREYGFAGVLAKPFKVTELYQALHDLLH